FDLGENYQCINTINLLELKIQSDIFKNCEYLRQVFIAADFSIKVRVMHDSFILDLKIIPPGNLSQRVSKFGFVENKLIVLPSDIFIYITCRFRERVLC